ncbi:Dipeptidyl aminopeptidase/acylaminoacyl peptidase [Paenibacillus sp. UNC496MF]|uniref:S9 family peptidase n=1 Tax=Paenibacillus sp. UNC496MF TaxID=1502753 RepID=UPI0008F2F875|nr:S9 family peptidase [Paenibacillus sp. UNC496MF]SFJ74247.1 Dipeptidyl aminopeptidase/acylaminoacyl peptidase [Paenibacillus sp. UNC496MF]
MIQFPKPDVEQFFQTYVIRDFAVAKDEKRLIFSSNLNGQPNLWAMDLPDAYPYPLTYNNQNANAIEIDPRGRFLLAGFDRDGDENYHIYALPAEGGNPLELIEGTPQEKFYAVKLSKDGERLYYVTSKDNPNFLNARVRHLAAGEDKLVYEGREQPTFLEAVSPDEDKFVVAKTFANTHQLGIVLAGGEETVVSPSPERVQVSHDFLFTDNDTLVYVTDVNRDFAYVLAYNLATRAYETVCEFDGEAVSGIKWHQASGMLYVWTERGTEHRMYAKPLAGGEAVPIPLPVDVVEKAVVADSGAVYILGRGAVQPFNLYRYADGEWTRLTQNRVTGLAEENLVYPDVVRYPSFDGLEIEALLFKAKADVANGYTIFWPHGGPQASEGKFFRAMFQFMLAYGYNIFAPNFRGSTGYGSAFVKLVEGDWGEGPRLDCVAGMEWLFEQGISSRDKLFVVGGSFGGYMTLLLAGRHADYFRAAVDIFGPSNLFTFMDSVPEDWKPLMERWLGHPERDRERLTKDSPITYLRQMVKPMLVIQGANDPRVVKAESDQIVAALQAQGTEVEYMVLDDEGHGFSKRVNEIAVYRRMLAFLNKHRA